MNFFNDPRYDSIKMLVIAVLVTGAGLFVYDQMKVKPLENAGRVISAGAGTTHAGGAGSGSSSGSGSGSGSGGAGTGPAGGGTKGNTTDPTCDPTAPVVLDTTIASPTTPTSVSTTTGGVSGGQWLNFNLTNPTNCPVTVSKVQIALGTNDVDSWPPVQNVALMHAGTQLGSMMKVEGAVRYMAGTLTVGTHTLTVSDTAPFSVGNKVRVGGATPAQGTITSIPSSTTMTVSITTAGAGAVAGTSTVVDYGSGTMTFSFPGTSAVTIGSYSTETFNLVGDSRNVPTHNGATSASVYFRFGLKEFLGTSMSGVVNDQTVTAGTIPATIISPTITVS